MVDGLQQEYVGRIDFDVYADVNADPQGGTLANEHGVNAVPTMMLSDPSGRETERWVGAVSADDLRSAFDESLR